MSRWTRLYGYTVILLESGVRGVMRWVSVPVVCSLFCVFAVLIHYTYSLMTFLWGVVVRHGAANHDAIHSSILFPNISR